ncbi:hypothetical protein [Cystobacter fuscus]|uniref:hypothetical protein n=1 Tax=Cystobacter fuscus TaxID=43 RepID=UPI0037BF0E69
MSDAAHEFAVVCEARADRDAACGLADRVLLEEVDWLAPETLDSCRKWRGRTSEEPFLRWASVRDEFQSTGIKGIFGGFGGQPGALDAHAARRALLLLASSKHLPDAVLLVRDSDGNPERRTGLEQARDARKWPFPVVIGLAEPKRECWVLVGFEPRTEEEKAQLQKEERRLSFHPVRDAHQLTAREHGAKKDAKKALEALTRGDPERERVCLEETPLGTLSTLGRETGLAAYLQDVRERLVPVLGGHRAPGSHSPP